MKAHFYSLSLVFTLLSWLFNTDIVAKDYKGAEYRTKLTYLYGRFEVRMKSAHRNGMLSSFFTYFDGTDEDPWANYKWNEIDIEIMGRYEDNVQFNTITLSQTNHVGHYPTNFSPGDDYHTYAFEWTPEYVSWFIDGTEVLKQTGDHIATITRAQKIMMNIWNPQYENWAGVFDATSLPAFAFYDWVSYYTYTPGSGNSGTDNNFTLDWTDNFDSWDTDRWEKATHTWAGNGCDFIPENAVFQDGKLILCLTNSTDTGYTDLTPPNVSWARASSNEVYVMFSEEINREDAEKISNYYITNSQITVNSATLQTDKKSVVLNVTGIDPNSSYLMIVYPIKDTASSPNISATRAISLIMSQQLDFPIKINCGSDSALGYLAEQSWDQTTEYGSMDGTISVYDTSLQINNTDEDKIFQSNRHNIVGYKVRVPNGRYDVKLLFSENDYSSVGTRVFDVYLEYQKVLEDFDIFGQAGKNTALIKEFTNIQVDDGKLDIHLADKVSSGLICGIVIIPNTTDVIDEKKYGVNDFNVEQNYPNPFNGRTIIKYSLQSPENLKFELYNVLGEQVFVENLGYISAGEHQYFLNTASLASSPLTSGIYFFVFSTANKKEIRKLVLLN